MERRSIDRWRCGTERYCFLCTLAPSDCEYVKYIGFKMAGKPCIKCRGDIGRLLKSGQATEAVAPPGMTTIWRKMPYPTIELS
jgi:hypothetical protein